VPSRRLVLLRGFWALATLAVAVFIFYQSTRGGADPTVPDLTTAEAYLGHLAVYAVLGFCAQTAVLSRRLRTVVAVVAAAALFGGCIEVYQSTIEGREGSAFDALANLTGAALGVLVAYGVTPHWGRLVRHG